MTHSAWTPSNTTTKPSQWRPQTKCPRSGKQKNSPRIPTCSASSTTWKYPAMISISVSALPRRWWTNTIVIPFSTSLPTKFSVVFQHRFIISCRIMCLRPRPFWACWRRRCLRRRNDFILANLWSNTEKSQYSFSNKTISLQKLHITSKIILLDDTNTNFFQGLVRIFHQVHLIVYTFSLNIIDLGYLLSIGAIHQIS